MRTLRIVIGAALLVALSGVVVAGVYVLYRHGGGGLPVEIRFSDIGGLTPGDHIFYGDRNVGRVERTERGADGYIVQARIVADHAGLVRENSRFWIESRLGSAILMFDRAGGTTVAPFHRFEGLAARPDPDPDSLPVASPRPLRARPVWLCTVRAVAVSRTADELIEQRGRRGAGAVVHARDGDLLVLAPAWLIEAPGELLELTVRVDIPGEGPRIAETADRHGEHVLLRVRGTGYSRAPSELWPYALAAGQGLVLAAADGTGSATVYTGGRIEYRGRTEQSLVALIDGTKLAGFGVPEAGASSGAGPTVRWVSLAGAGNAIDAALR